MTASETSLFEMPDWADIGGSSAYIERRKEAQERALRIGLPSFEEEL